MPLFCESENNAYFLKNVTNVFQKSVGYFCFIGYVGAYNETDFEPDTLALLPSITLPSDESQF